MLTQEVGSALNLIGIFAFALSGALVGVRRRFDVVGMAVLATGTALGGGIVRDLLIGTQVAALRNPWWLLLPLAATLVAFFFHPQVARLHRTVEVVDAIGLGVFCATATTKALVLGVSPIAAVLLGSITGVGGGVLRDLLAGVTPVLFRPDSRLYAVPAVIGCLAVALTAQVTVVTVLVQTLAAALVCGLRLLALWRGWTAPVPRMLADG